MIVRSDKLNKKIYDYYLGYCTLYDLGLEYFNLKLYSAASSFFLRHFVKTNNYKNKSKCLSYIAECMLNQVTDESTGWQQYVVETLSKYALTYDRDNIQALNNIIKLNEKYNIYDYNREKYDIKNNVQYLEYINTYLYDKMNNDEFIDFIFKLLEYQDKYIIIKNDEYYDNIINEIKKRDILIYKDQNKIDKLITTILSYKHELTNDDINLLYKFCYFNDIYNELFKLLNKRENIIFFEFNNTHYSYSMTYILENKYNANGIIVNNYSLNGKTFRNTQPMNYNLIYDWDLFVGNLYNWYGKCDVLIYDNFIDKEYIDKINFSKFNITIIITTDITNNLLNYYNEYTKINEYYILKRKENI